MKAAAIITIVISLLITFSNITDNSASISAAMRFWVGLLVLCAKGFVLYYIMTAT